MSTAASIATRGMLESAACIVTDGFLCPRRRVFVSPAPTEALDRRTRQDLKDIQDIVELLFRVIEDG